MPLPTRIVVHARERRSKCSVEPLRGRPGFQFHTWTGEGKLTPAIESLTGYVRLGMTGPELSPQDAHGGLLILDATWKLAERMEAAFATVPPRSLPGHWRTAYPRVSKLFSDPAAGLATIEALYAAHIALGRDVTGLLDHYRWGEEFLQLNAAAIPPSSVP